jgi:hypothetical protein
LAQHKCQSTLAGPAVVVPKLNVSNGVAPTATSKLPPVYPGAAVASVAQVVPLATTLSWLLLANAVPVTCTIHETVIGHSFLACVSGPFTVNTPTSKE